MKTISKEMKSLERNQRKSGVEARKIVTNGGEARQKAVAGDGRGEVEMVAFYQYIIRLYKRRKVKKKYVYICIVEENRRVCRR